MEEEAENFVAKCDKCQRYGNNMHRPVELLHPVIAPWPFMKWGMDIVGLLPQVKGQEHSNRCEKKKLEISFGKISYVNSIKRITSTPYHPVGNGQTESTNKVIINNLKKRLEEPKVEIGEPSTRFTQASEESNGEQMRIILIYLKGKEKLH
ncbi:uncharacterized protein [Nicotiana sylvestris]|uniref:uncharacterized protein n=1 Tax=Nicotiana sylvestris TaxID=4096 RepID=UPI00388C6E54